MDYQLRMCLNFAKNLLRIPESLVCALPPYYSRMMNDSRTEAVRFAVCRAVSAS